MRDLRDTSPLYRLRWWLVRKLVGRKAAVVNVKFHKLEFAADCPPIVLLDNEQVSKQ